MLLRIKRSSINGCCAGSYFYDLGGAHGHPRAPSFEEFAKKIITLGYSTVNTAVTNPYQTQERQYLEQLGFKVVDKNKELWVHVGYASDLHKNLSDLKKKIYEERNKKLQEERENREALRRQAGENTQTKGRYYPIRISAWDIRRQRLIGEHYTDFAKRLYNIDLPDNFNTGLFYSAYSSQEERVARAINRRLAKRRALGD